MIMVVRVVMWKVMIVPEVGYVPGHITLKWPGGTKVIIRD